MKMIVLFLILLSFKFARANEKVVECEALINGESGFVSYLSQLVEQQVIGETELKKLIDGIKDRSEIVNPVPHEVTQRGVVFTSSADQIHYGQVDSYIRNSQLDQQKILGWARMTLSQNDRARGQRFHTRLETIEDIYQKMEFHRVEPGKFTMLEHIGIRIFRSGPFRWVKVKLTHPFEAMSTQVTQMMWVDVMGENPSHFSDGAQSVVTFKHGKQIRLNPDHPIENITWWSAIVFANKLSERMGLEPAYDVSNIKFKEGTSAEAGTLDTVERNVNVKINARFGDVYRAEGFRLPTEAEQVFLLSDRGKAESNYFADVSGAAESVNAYESTVKQYVWYRENSGNRTHAVAELMPMIIDGKDFYDLYGNVLEWSNDWYQQKLNGGRNPRGPNRGVWRILRGMHFSSPQPLNTYSRDLQVPNMRDQHIGFRLVRTVK